MPDVKKTKTPKPEYIKNYGLFWRRDDVVWGSIKNTGTLLGKEKNTDKSPKINFRAQTGFYALYDEAFNLVYFGQVGAKNKRGEESKDRTLYTRLNEHCKGSLTNRWSYFSWFGIKKIGKDNELVEKGHFNSKPDIFLNQVEAIVLEVAEPSRNKKSGSFSGAAEYFQYKDERLSPIEERLEQIEKQLNAITKK